MGRNREINVASRAIEFKKHGFVTSGTNILMCKYCNTRVEWKRRDSCEKHIQSKGHLNRVQLMSAQDSAPKRQCNIEESLQAQNKAKEEKYEFVMDTTEMFLKVSLVL